jgi:hypothetical protein
VQERGGLPDSRQREQRKDSHLANDGLLA